MKRHIVELLLVFAAFILQCTLFKLISLGGVVPNLLLMLTSSFGFMKGRKEGMFVGFFSGILTDILFGNGIIGLFALIYVWVGYGNGLFTRLFYPEDIKLPLILIGASDFLLSFVTYVLTFLLRSRLDLPYYFLRVMMPELVYTLVMALLLYRFILSVETSLELEEDSREERENS